MLNVEQINAAHDSVTDYIEKHPAVEESTKQFQELIAHAYESLSLIDGLKKEVGELKSHVFTLQSQLLEGQCNDYKPTDTN